MREHVLTVTAKDCDREVFRSGGHGGQNQNKTSSGVRWRHRASGAVGESRQSRSQEENARIAWRRMAQSATFLKWVHEQHTGLKATEETINLLVAESMDERHLKIEVRRDGVWVEL
jgi:protein subunit release factor B